MKAVVTGGTGLVGSFLLKALEAEPFFAEVVVLTRRIPGGDWSKTKWRTADLGESKALEQTCAGADVAFCALGTTIKKAGSQEAFRKVDYEYVINFAQAAKKAGVKQFHVVSAVGASAKSSMFYSRVKGEMEEAINGLGFEGIFIYQPSFLEGPREERRLGERIGGAVMQLLSPLFAGKAAKYKPIHVRTVAYAMLNNALQGERGIHVMQYREMISSGGE